MILCVDCIKKITALDWFDLKTQKPFSVKGLCIKWKIQNKTCLLENSLLLNTFSTTEFYKFEVNGYSIIQTFLTAEHNLHCIYIRV